MRNIPAADIFDDSPDLTTHYKLRKLHSLLGIVPVGLFLMEHLSVNSLAATANGERVFNAAVNVLRGMPYLIVVEVLFIILPLLFHGLYGVVIYLGAKQNLSEYNLFRNWMYVLQRLSGVITFVFVIAHVGALRVQSILQPGLHINFDHMTAHLATPWVLAFYIIGVLCAVYHFANGIWNFCITWGITVGPRAQKTCAWICGFIGAGLAFMGVNALLVFVGKGLILTI